MCIRATAGGRSGLGCGREPAHLALPNSRPGSARAHQADSSTCAPTRRRHSPSFTPHSPPASHRPRPAPTARALTPVHTAPSTAAAMVRSPARSSRTPPCKTPPPPASRSADSPAGRLSHRGASLRVQGGVLPVCKSPCAALRCCPADVVFTRDKHG